MESDLLFREQKRCAAKWWHLKRRRRPCSDSTSRWHNREIAITPHVGRQRWRGGGPMLSLRILTTYSNNGERKWEWTVSPKRIGVRKRAIVACAQIWIDCVRIGMRCKDRDYWQDYSLEGNKIVTLNRKKTIQLGARTNAKHNSLAQCSLCDTQCCPRWVSRRVGSILFASIRCTLKKRKKIPEVRCDFWG